MCIFTCIAIEIQHGIHPKELIFINFGTVFQTDNLVNLKIKISTSNISEESKMMESHLNRIMDICSKLVENTICKPIENFMNIKNNQFKQQHRIKRFLDIRLLDITFNGNIFDQFGESQIRKDILENRYALFNQTQILNNTWTVQRRMNNETLIELSNMYNEIHKIENESISMKRNIRLSEITQSVMLEILRNSEIYDAINNILRDPVPSDILKITNSNDMYNIFKGLNSTIQSHELIANSPELNIYDILSLSKMKAKMNGHILKINIDIPITTSPWRIFKIHPIIFKKGSELVEITNVSKYFLENEHHEHLLFSTDELRQCHSSVHDIFCCTFNTTNVHLNSCESNVRYKNKLDGCQTEPSVDRQRIIQINESMIYLNNFDNQRVIWGCFNFEKMFEVNDSVWINSLPGCHVKIRNRMFVVPSEGDQTDLEPQFVLDPGSSDHFKYDFKVQMRNGTIRKEEFSDQIRDIEDKLKYLANQTRKMIENSNVSIKPNIKVLSWFTESFEIFLCMILLAIIIVLICCICK